MKKTFIAVTVISLFFGGIFAYVRAQTTSTSTPPKQPTVEELNDFRNKIFDLFGIPHDTPMTIYDVMNGKVDGKVLPHPVKLPQTQGVLGDLELVLDKDNFTPGQEIQAVLVTFSTDLQKAQIQWYLNGKLVLSGTGKVLYTFKLGSSGSATTLRAAVTAQTGEYREITKTIRPARIHLVWSADTYTPLWYRGKTLASGGSMVTVYAIPSFYIGNALLNRQDLIYEWAVNSENPSTDPKISGIGKSSYSFKISDLMNKSYDVKVRVRDLQNRIVTHNTISFYEIQPSLELYATNQLYGVTKWLSGRPGNIKSGDSFSIIAEPFYVTRDDFENLVYEWKINDQNITSGGVTSRKLLFSTESGSQGTQTVNVLYNSKKNILRRGSGEAVINVQN